MRLVINHASLMGNQKRLMHLGTLFTVASVVWKSLLKFNYLYEESALYSVSSFFDLLAAMSNNLHIVE
ncbi:Uncharacterised protein [Legionella cincinnatiensis]|uniref:Uncharacterized protein n=1 Tax=Legionella cincinnatiensis TaxID=28085 RepID=A0A378IGX2_9GAMM|nr:hypothetical protein Lcin_2250 [Legionella cincinnatiensis]STX34477.1 Uncharacterised protein [Legionella cincinnatiensis]